MNIKKDVGAEADFQKLINYLIIDNGIKPKDLAVAMKYNNGADSAVIAFKKKGEPKWTQIQGLIKHLYKLDPDFSADDLFKGDCKIAVTAEEEKRAQVPFKQLSAEHKELQAKYSKLLSEYNALRKKQDTYKNFADAYNKLTTCQRDTFCRFVNTPDLAEFLQILRMFAERKMKGVNSRYKPDKKTFFVFYDFSKLSNLLDVICEKTVFSLREDILTEKRAKYKTEFVARERRRIADKIKNILLSSIGGAFVKEGLPICKNVTKHLDWIDPKKITSKSCWQKFSSRNPYPPDSVDFYFHIAQNYDTYNLDKREKLYKNLYKIHGVDAPNEPYHYVTCGENLPRYHYKTEDYNSLLFNENSAKVEEWYYGDILPTHNSIMANGTINVIPADTDKKLENNF